MLQNHTGNWYIIMSVCLSVHPSVYLSVYLSIHQSVCLSVHPSICPSVRPSPPCSVRSDRSRWNWINGSAKKRGQSHQPEVSSQLAPPPTTPPASDTDNICVWLFVVQEAKPKARLIVFVVGGLTHSEIRAAYEVSKQYPSHDVIIGEDDVMMM